MYRREKSCNDNTNPNPDGIFQNNMRQEVTEGQAQDPVIKKENEQGDDGILPGDKSGIYRGLDSINQDETACAQKEIT